MFSVRIEKNKFPYSFNSVANKVQKPMNYTTGSHSLDGIVKNRIIVCANRLNGVEELTG